MTQKPTSVELFAGGGGMALGMRQAGFSHAALVEWWAPAARVLRRNADRDASLWGVERVLEKDVRESVQELSEMGSINLVAGGPPCQPFSLAGAGAGHSDERNMFPAALEIVRNILPDYVVFENVPGLLRPSFAPYFEYVKDQLRRPFIAPKEGESWDQHHSRLLGSKLDAFYVVHQEAIDAADVGVAQSRKRIFLVAVRAGLGMPREWTGISSTHSRDVLLYQQWITGEYWEKHGLPSPAARPERLGALITRLERRGVPADKLPWTTLRDLLRGVPEPRSTESSDDWPNHIAIPGARTYANHNGSPLDSPSKTIKAGVHGVAGGEAMLRELDGSVRYLTVREAALVQGFPREYEFPGVRSRVMGVIGNAVAVDVAAKIGERLLGLHHD